MGTGPICMVTENPFVHLTEMIILKAARKEFSIEGPDKKGLEI